MIHTSTGMWIKLLGRGLPVANEHALRAVDDARSCSGAHAGAASGSESSHRVHPKSNGLMRLGASASEDFIQLSPLWVGGLMILGLLAVSLLLGGPDGWANRRQYDWALYLSLGLSFAVSLGIGWMASRPSLAPGWAGALATVLTFLTAASAIVVAFSTGRWLAFPLTFVQLGALVFILRRVEGIHARDLVALLAVALAAWVAAIPLIWWEPAYSALMLQLPSGLVTILVAGGIALWGIGTPLRSSALSDLFRRIDRAVDIGAVAIFWLLAARTDGLFEAYGPLGTIHHWGAFVGPAEQVRAGGWLLWDVPSQYGLLLTWVLAWLPFSSVWQSLYFLNAATLFLAALGVYWSLRSLRPDAFGKIVALSSAIAAVFLASTWAPNLDPTHYFPSSGPLRFIWCYLLLAILTFESRTAPGSRGQVLFILAGSVTWLLGVLWSFESAAQCTAVWLPAYAYIVITRDLEDKVRGRLSWRLIVQLLLPFVLIAATVLAMGVFFVDRLGHLPDARGYVEYVFAFGSGDASRLQLNEQVSLDVTDAHLVVILVLSIVCASVVMLFQGSGSDRLIPILIGAGAAVWVISSYSIGRPHPHTISRSWTIILIALAAATVIVTRRRGWRHSLILRMAIVPVVAMLLLLTYSNVPALQTNLSGLQDQRSPRDLTQGLPTADPALVELLKRASVQDGDPIVFDGDVGGNVMPVWVGTDGQLVIDSPSWMPSPLLNLSVLPDERRQTYMARMTDRLKAGGWYVQRAGERVTEAGRWAGSGSWFFEQLTKTHVPVQAFQNGDWQIVWFEYVGNDNQVPRPEYSGGRLQPAPDQLSIQGVPVGSVADPSVWMIPAEGWKQIENGRLSLELPARTFIYSDRVRPVTLSLIGISNAEKQRLAVSVNGNPSQRFARTGDRTSSVQLRLNQGWNEVGIVVHRATSKTDRMTDNEAGENSRSRSGVAVDGLDLSLVTQDGPTPVVD
jgi:hypothetical protein